MPLIAAMGRAKGREEGLHASFSEVSFALAVAVCPLFGLWPVGVGSCRPIFSQATTWLVHVNPRVTD